MSGGVGKENNGCWLKLVRKERGAWYPAMRKREEVGAMLAESACGGWLAWLAWLAGWLACVYVCVFCVSVSVCLLRACVRACLAGFDGPDCADF